MRVEKTSSKPTTLSENKEGVSFLIDQLIDDAIYGEAFNYNKMFNMFEELKIILSERKFPKLKISITEYKTNDDEMELQKYTSKIVIKPKAN